MPALGTLVAIDPGLRECGVAVFKNGVLKRAFLLRNKEKTIRGPRAWHSMACALSEALPDCYVDEAVLEVMEAYPGHRGGNPNDLIQTTGASAWLAGVLAPDSATGYLPKQWKGQVPKPIHNARIEACLSEAEAKAFDPCPASLRHNVVDAVGIGLFHLGRLARGDS